MGWSAGLNQIVSTTTSINAAYFGFQPNTNNTAAWVAFATWLAGLADGERYTLQLAPGTYYADYIELLKPANGLTSSVEIVGAGIHDTILTPNATAAPVFLTIDAAYLVDVKIRGLGIVGIGATNPNQDGFAVVAIPRAGDNTGGITFGELSRIQVDNFNGRQMWYRGSQRSTAGLLASKLPNQFLCFDNILLTKRNSALPAFESGGQFGQAKFILGSLGGQAATTGGPVIVLADELRCVVIQPLSVDIASDVVSATAVVYFSPCTEMRIVGTSLPTGLSKGMTYFIDTVGRGGATPDASTFTLHTSRANAASGTKFNFVDAGTPASWTLVPLWALSLSSSEFTTEFNHRLVTGDLIRFRGAGLPTGAINVTTDWYVIRTGHRTFKLASSDANALSGTSTGMTGGTISDFGFVLNDGTPSGLAGAYSVDLDGTSTEGSQLGVLLVRASDIRLRLHVEETRRSIEASDSAVTVDGGLFANAASDAGKGVWLAAIGSNGLVAVAGMPYLNGTIDKLYSGLGPAIRVDDAGIAFGSTPPAVQSTGMAYQVGVSGNAIAIAGNTRIFVNTSASAIKNITSSQAVGSKISVMAWSGPITFDSTGVGAGTIRLPASSTTLTLPQTAVATFEMWDTVGTWVLTGKSG